VWRSRQRSHTYRCRPLSHARGSNASPDEDANASHSRANSLRDAGANRNGHRHPSANRGADSVSFPHRHAGRYQLCHRYPADFQQALHQMSCRRQRPARPAAGSYEEALKGSAYRPVVVPGDPEKSQLVRRIRGDSTPRMPFDGPPFLTEDQIVLIMTWIAAGAPNN